MFGPGGHARVVAFCALEGRIPNATPDGLRPIAQVTHVTRRDVMNAQVDPLPYAVGFDAESTHFTDVVGAEVVDLHFLQVTHGDVVNTGFFERAEQVTGASVARAFGVCWGERR